MEQNAGFDSPSELDRKYEELFGTTDYPEEYMCDYIPVTDQSLFPDTRMACTRFGLGGINMAQGKYDFDCRAFWLRYTKENPEAIQVGATLQSALSQGRSERIVIANVKVTTQDQARSSISKNMFIYTGSLNGDRENVRNNGVYKVGNKKIGHIFRLIGYDRDGFFGLNSYGKKNGIFYIPNELFDTLYSKYAIMTDQELAGGEKEKRDEADKKLAYKYVMSDAEANRPITRGEIAIVMGRMIRLAKPDIEA